jgi:hypothetical protein
MITSLGVVCRIINEASPALVRALAVKDAHSAQLHAAMKAVSRAIMERDKT